jgi:hypothetical protein
LITLPELLDDPMYRKFFLTVPKVYKPLPGGKPWRAFIRQRPDGPWAKKEFERYAEAFDLIKKYRKLGKLYDGAIQSRSIAYGPPERVARVVKGGKPVYHTRDGKRILGADGKPIQKTVTIAWRPKLEATEEAHLWCTFCRRPTVFKWFLSHHMVKTWNLHGLVDVGDRRCTICGAKEEFVQSTRVQAFSPDYDPLAYLKTKRIRSRR